jgi:hypothetical protein
MTGVNTENGHLLDIFKSNLVILNKKYSTYPFLFFNFQIPALAAIFFPLYTPSSTSYLSNSSL